MNYLDQQILLVKLFGNQLQITTLVKYQQSMSTSFVLQRMRISLPHGLLSLTKLKRLLHNIN